MIETKAKYIEHEILGTTPMPRLEVNQQLRVLLVAHKFPPYIGGIEMHTFEVGRRMAALGHLVTVLTADNSRGLPKEEIVAGMRVARVPAYPKASDLFIAPGIYGEIVRGSWDVVHVQGFHTFVPPIAMLAAVRRRAAFVMTFHSGGHSSPLRRIIRSVQRAVLRPLIVRADMLIAVSEFEAETFAHGLNLPRGKFVVVPNGAEIEKTANAKPADAQNPLILSIGRLEKYKGHHRVVAAFAELLKVKPTARLRIAGEGPEREALAKLIANLGLEGSVTIAGVPPAQRTQMGDLLSEASAVVLLSDYEAHPVAALEAISLGRPVLASNSTGFLEMAAKGQLRGIDPNSPPWAIAKAILEEIDRPLNRDQDLAISDWNLCTQALLKVYRDVLGARSHSTDADGLLPEE